MYQHDCWVGGRLRSVLMVLRASNTSSIGVGCWVLVGVVVGGGGGV
jgi:hypothetical protein